MSAAIRKLPFILNFRRGLNKLKLYKIGPARASAFVLPVQDFGGNVLALLIAARDSLAHL